VLVCGGERFCPRQPVAVHSQLSGQTFGGVVVRVEPPAAAAASPGGPASSSSGRGYAAGTGAAMEGEVSRGGEGRGARVNPAHIPTLNGSPASP
jgi:hypothetical protein